MWQIYARTLLKKHLVEMKKRNPSYSLRAFARKLEISPSALSEIIAGRRKVSRRTASRVFGKINMTASEQERLNSLMRQEESRKPLPEDVFSVIASWQYYAILSLFELSSPPDSVRGIARRLNIPEDEVKVCLATMEKVGMIQPHGGFYSVTGEHFTSSDGVPSEAVMKGHESELNLAAKRLRTLPPDERDFTCLTFAGSSKEMEKARKEIRRFRDRLYSIMSGASKDQVFKLSVQLFPVLEKDIAD